MYLQEKYAIEIKIDLYCKAMKTFQIHINDSYIYIHVEVSIELVPLLIKINNLSQHLLHKK